jgi:hypothetical protein
MECGAWSAGAQQQLDAISEESQIIGGVLLEFWSLWERLQI